MLKQGYFINHRFFRLLFFSLISLGSCTLESMIDSIIGGCQLGETALSAIAIVTPLTVFATCISEMFSGGYAMIYGKYIGAFDKDMAYRSAGESLLFSLFLGGLIYFVLSIIKEPFLRAFNCTGELFDYASDYYRCIVIFTSMHPFVYALYALIIIDGDSFVAMLSTIAQMLNNVILSYVLFQKNGVTGIGMASIISCILGIMIYLSHFLRKSNSIRLKLSWSFPRMMEAFKLNLGSFLHHFFIFAENIILNKVIILACGVTRIPVYVIINFILSCFFTAGVVYESGAGFFAAFIGENNNYGIRNLYRTCKKALWTIGIAFNIVFIFGAGLLPKLYQISTPELYHVSIITSAILAFSAIPFCFTDFYCRLYPAFGKPSFSLLLSFLSLFICPLIFTVPFAFIFGIIGIPAGITSGSLLTVFLFWGIARIKYGKEGFPLYLKDEGNEVIGFDFQVTLEIIPEIRKRVVTLAQTHGFANKNLELLVEEIYIRILEKNPGKKIISECTLFFERETVILIIRDNGIIYNYVDDNNAVESLNAFVLNSMLERIETKRYALTTSYNRYCLVFDKVHYPEISL